MSSASQYNHDSSPPPTERFCSQCGAVVQSADAAMQALRFCEQCGKAQYSPAQTMPAAISKANSLGNPVDNRTDDNAEHSSPALLYKRLAVALGLVFLVGAASFGTTRLMIDKPAKQDVQQEGQSSATGSEPSGGNAADPMPVPPETQAALQRLQDSLAAEPNNSGVLLRLANAWYDAGAAYQSKNAVFLARQAFAKAEQHYGRYLKEFDAKNVAARIDYAYTLLVQGRTDDAVTETKKALDYEKDHPIALFNLGVIYNRKGDMEESKRYFKRCIEVAPNSDAAKSAEQLLKELEAPAKGAS